MNIIDDIKLINKSDYDKTLKSYTDVLLSLPEVDGVYTYGGTKVNPGISDLDIVITITSKVSYNFDFVYNKWKEIGDFGGYIIKHPPLVCTRESIKLVVFGLGFNLNTVYGKNYDNLRDVIYGEQGVIWIESLYWDYLSLMYSQLLRYTRPGRDFSKREFLYLIGSISHSLKYAIKLEDDADINLVISKIEFYRSNYKSLRYNDIIEFSNRLYTSLWKSSFIVARSSLIFNKKIMNNYMKYYYFEGKDIYIFKSGLKTKPSIKSASKIRVVDMPLPLFIYNEIIRGFNVSGQIATENNVKFGSLVREEAYTFLEKRNTDAIAVERVIMNLDLPKATIIPLGNRGIYKRTTNGLISKNQYLQNNYLLPIVNGIRNYIHKIKLSL